MYMYILTEVTLFRAQALRVKRYSYWICVRRKRAGADGGFMVMQLHTGETAGPRTAEWPNPIPLFSRSHPTSGSRVPTTDLL